MKWRKFFLSLIVIIPAAVVCSYALGYVLWETKAYGLQRWQSPLLWFSIGMGSWFLLFIVLPRPMWLYVFGHELTHAISAWLFGGTVFRMKVSSRGGYIKTDKNNVWIALAPYFFPIYSGLILWIWWLLSFWIVLEPWELVLYGLLGMSWAFHLTFTVWMLVMTEQSDIAPHGNLFSFSLIYWINLMLLTFFLVLVMPEITWQDWWKGLNQGWHWSRGLGLSFYHFLL